MEKTQSLKQKLIQVILLFLAVLIGCTFISRSIYEYLLPVVSTAQVKSGVVEVKYLATGKIGLNEESLKSQQAILVPSISGQVIEVFKQEGEFVEKGEALCTVQKGDYETEASNKAFQETELTIAYERLARQIASKEEEVDQLEISYVIKQKELEQYETSSKLIDLKEQIKEQRKLVQVNEELHKEGLIAISSYEAEKNKLATLERSLVDEAKAIETALKQSMQDIQNQLAEVTLSLEDLKEEQFLNKQKQQLISQSSLSETLVSPMEGYVYRLNVAKGAYVQTGEQLLVVIPKALNYGLSFEVSEETANKIQMGQRVSFTFNQMRYEASINKKKFKEENGQYVMTAEVEEQLLKQMQLEPTTYKTVSVEITNRSSEYQMIVDQSAIKKVYTNAYVLVVEESEGIGRKVYKVREVPVTILEEGDYKVAISAQIDQNQRIITSHLGDLKDGQEVALK